MFPFRQIAALTLASISLVACTDQRDMLSPQSRSAAIIPIGGGGGIVQIPRGTDLMEITAGEYHTCVRRRNGSVYCWGQNIEHQVGVASSASCWYLGSPIPCVPQPTVVLMTTSSGAYAAAAHITAGAEHTCALDTLKTAWCWGSNSEGQIGKGTGGNASVPVAIAGMSFFSLGAGGEGTCGSSIYAGLYCWGRYPLGPSPGPYSPTFIPFSSALLPLAVSPDHVCGNSGSNQWVCWGTNTDGQLAADPATSPTLPFFTPVHLFDGATNVAVGSRVTCADQSSGVVQCVGFNLVQSTRDTTHFGLLGNPQFMAQFSFAAQTPGALHGVAVNGSHVCALDGAGNAWCWGLGDSGQLGNATFQGSTAPVMVLGGHTFRALAVGRDHSCGIGTDNHVYCWGDNTMGQLGTGAWSWPFNTPVAVYGL
jgi:alpha-tubulin suppressor-like RCC1 family protein